MNEHLIKRVKTLFDSLGLVFSSDPDTDLAYKILRTSGFTSKQSIDTLTGERVYRNNNRNSVWSSGSNKSNWNSEFKDLIDNTHKE